MLNGRTLYICCTPIVKLKVHRYMHWLAVFMFMHILGFTARSAMSCIPPEPLRCLILILLPWSWAKTEVTGTNGPPPACVKRLAHAFT